MRVLFWAVLIATSLQASAEWSIRCDVNGKKLPLVGTDGKTLFVQSDGEKISAPTDAVWTVDGDLRAEQAQICWSPTYSLTRAAPGIDIPRSKAGAYVASISAVQTAYLTTPSFAVVPNHWPALSGDPAVLFFGWLAGGQISHMSASPIAPRPKALAFNRQDTIYLTAEEAQGQPILILWQGGRVIMPNPTFADERANRAWHATMRDDVDELKLFLPAIKADTLGADEWGLLHFAAQAGSEHVVQLLLEGAPILTLEGKGAITPLYIAAGLGRTRIVDRLLAAGAPKDVVSPDGVSPLHHAARGGHLAIVNRLIKAHASVSTISEQHETPLAAAINHGHPDVAAALYHAGGKLDVGVSVAPELALAYNPFSDDHRFQRVLLTRTLYNDLETVAWLLEMGVSADSTELGATALSAGAETADSDVTKLLIRSGAKPNRADKQGITALMRAAIFGNVGYAEALLEGGAAVNGVDAKRRSALHLAARWGQSEVVALLLERGADLLLKDSDRYSAFEHAVLSGSTETVEMFIKYGARIDLKSTHLKEIIEAATVLDRADLLSEAMKEGGSIREFGEKSWSAYQIAQLSKATRCLSLFEQSSLVGTSGVSIVPSKQLDTPLKPVKMKSPDNPRSSRGSVAFSRVQVFCAVDTDGRVKFPRVVGRSNPALAASVMDAVRTWRFSPPKKDGVPVATTIVIPFDFSSDRGDLPSLATVDEVPVVIRQDPAEYPTLGRPAEGTVTAQFTITATGDVTDVEIEGASDPAFAQASREAVEKWKYKPAILGGKPVSVRCSIPMIYSFRD